MHDAHVLMQVLCRNGGGIFHGTCTKVKKAGSQCYWVGLSTSPEATMAVIENNTAHGANVFIFTPKHIKLS
jgi:hypothetical protein